MTTRCSSCEWQKQEAIFPLLSWFVDANFAILVRNSLPLKNVVIVLSLDGFKQEKD